MTGLDSARARSTRKRLPGHMVVDSHTIGSNLHFPLISENISKSGMLLSWESQHPVPFQENTLIEMKIDITGSYLKEPLSCLGKIVRRLTQDGGSYCFGIRIVQIDPKDLYVWESMVQELEADQLAS